MKSSITRKLTAVFFAAMFVMFVALATAPGANAATTTKPTGAISINEDAEATKNVSVTVTLTPSSEIASFCLSNTQIRTCSAWTPFNAEASDVPWTLNGAKDGVKTVYALFKDGSSNISSLIKDTIRLDRTPPAGSIKINNGAATTSTREVTLNLTAIDRKGSGIAGMSFSTNDGDSWTDTETFNKSKSITLPAGSGLKVVLVKFTDKAGNVSGPYGASIMLDQILPTATLLINDGDTYTNSASVTLALSVSGNDVSKVCYSNTNTSECTKWENLSATKRWTLSKDDGTKTVYAWVKDKAGNSSATYASDSIILDTTKPTGSISIENNATATNSALVEIILNPSDEGSGVVSYCLSNTPVRTCNTWTTIEDAPVPETVKAASTTITTNWFLDVTRDGAKPVYALFKDEAGNISSAVKDDIKLDITPPTGSIQINKGASQTNSPAATLTLAANDGSGSGVAQMTFSTDNGAHWSSLVDFAATKPITLPAGDGVKTVQVMFSDVAGNFSGPYGASIVLDTTAPTATLSINNGATYTNSTVVTLNLTASDAGSGIDKVCFSNTNAADCTKWETFSADRKYTLSKENEAQTVYAQAMDKAGNKSAFAHAAITLDTVKPVGGELIIDGGDYTNSAGVNVNLDPSDEGGSGVASYCLSNTDKCEDSEWKEYLAEHTIFTLDDTKDGLKTVYAWFKDKAGNTSTVVKDTITLDTTAPTFTITTAPFNTAQSNAQISGTKEAGSTVSVSLNGTPISDLSITQTPTGTSWSATVGTFTKKVNVVSVAATDAAMNPATAKTLNISYIFDATSLTGEWQFVNSGFDTTEHESWTGHGSINVSANLTFSGTYSDNTEDGSAISGSFAIDADGNITGSVTDSEGTATQITSGKMDFNRSMFTVLAGNDTMLTAVKKGSGGFLQSDLTGSWHMYSIYSQQYVYPPLATATSAVGWGVMTCAENSGDLSGTFDNIYAPVSTIILKGSIVSGSKAEMDGGVVSGTLTIKNDQTQKTTTATFSGQMSNQKNIALIHSTGTGTTTTGSYNKLIIIKDGGTFNQSDIAGSWYLKGIYGDINSGEVYDGQLAITTTGAVTGSINGKAVTGTFQIDATGVITANQKLTETVSGKEYSIKDAKIDSTKNIMTFVSGLKVFVGYLQR